MRQEPGGRPGAGPALLFYVARRYLRSTRRDAFVSFLSATATGGLALGVAALILALAALTGFQEALRREILSRTPEIEVELPAGADPTEARRLALEMPGVQAAQLLVRGQGWLLVAGRVRPVELVGFSGSLPASFPVRGEAGEGLYLGDRLVEAWGLEPGQVVEVASGRPTLSPFGAQPRVRRLPLRGAYTTGRTELVERVALPLAAAESLVGERGYRLVVSSGDLGAALRLAPLLADRLPAGSAVRTWQDLNRGLFFALRLEKTLMFAAVLLIVLVAALALVSDLTLIIASKRSEVGILAAMGTAPVSLQGIFLILGGLLAGIGLLAGAAVGIGGALLLDRYRLLQIPESVYFLDYIPFRVRPLDLVVILGATLAVALGGALYAARRAAALSPVEALRR